MITCKVPVHLGYEVSSHAREKFQVAAVYQLPDENHPPGWTHFHRYVSGLRPTHEPRAG